MAGLFTRGQGRVQTKFQRRKRPLIATLSMGLLLCMVGGFLSMSFAPQTEAFAATVAETAAVGGDSPYAYKGVNSMVGTLVSWGADNYTTTTKTVGSWYIDNNGYIVWGSNGTHNLPITYAVPKDNSLSKIQLIKATNGASSVPAQITTANGKSISIDNRVTTEDGLGTYFTVGAPGRTSAADMAEDWEKAIVAASHYSKSGLLQNEAFGTKSSIGTTEFPNDDTWAADYNKTGTTGGFGKQQNTTVANNTYIYIKLMADWTAPVVNTMTEGGEQSIPGDRKKYVNRFVEEAKLKSAEDAAEEAGVTRARGEGFFEFDLGANDASNTLQTGNNHSLTNPTYQKGAEEGASKESGPHFSLGTSFSNQNSISNLHNTIKYNQFSAAPSEEPFSFGRLAIPDNCYVIVDLNGHTLDRNLDAVDDTIHQNVICPSVFLAGLYSRLEVFDSSASDSNPAGTGKIMGATGLNGDGIIDGCPPDYVSRASKPAWNVDAWGNSMKGGGVKLGPRAEFTLHSGTIMHNSAIYGGAIYGTANNYIYIYDGVMTGNTACKGGATYLSSDSQMVFNMFGGSISGNGADWRRLTRYIHVKDETQVLSPGTAIPEGWKDTGIGTGFRGFGEDFNKEAWSNVVSYDGKNNLNVKSGEINSEGGGVCVFKNTYFNMYGGSISYNYSYEYAGGVNVNNTSFFKMYGGEITENVVTGEMREIAGATLADGSTPKANVGGGGVNMFQDSAGIYLNGPGRIMNNHTCIEKFNYDTPYTAENIAAYLSTNKGSLADSNLYLSLTKSDHTQTTFSTESHLYPEIKVQGPLYRDATHVAQVSITPAAGIEAGGYIMRQFYPKGWEDSSDPAKQGTEFNGTDGPRPLKTVKQGDGSYKLDESSHAKDQINTNGGTEFNLREFLKTGATSGYVDGFLFTDGGTSIVAGTGDDEGWYMALGTKQKGNLPVQWQYYDSTVDPATNKARGWTKAEATAATGTGFTLVYNGTDRRYDIRVFVDRTKLTADMSGNTSGYFYLYYDYYTIADKDGKETELEDDGTPKKHYLYANDKDKNSGQYTNILLITSGYDDKDIEIVQKNGVIYASERYDRLGYRFTIRADAKNLKGAADGTATPFNAEDKFQANPNYATMKIERATLMVSQIKLADITRYYDGTTDFYIPSDTISEGTLTGQAPSDQSKLLMHFSGDSNGYVHGTLNSPNVGTNNVALGVIIEELGGEDHRTHDKNTYPDKCLLANYRLYDLNTETMYPAEDRGEMSVTLNVTVKPKPITVELEKQSYEYGSIPVFGEEWGTHYNTANWAETYGKTSGGKESDALKALFSPDEKVPSLGEEGFDPNKLGTDGKLAQIDIDTLGVDDEHGGILDKDNLPLRLDQILKISFTSAYMERSSVGTYGGTFNYTNTNYAVTWVLGEQKVESFSGSTLQPATIDNLIEITKRRIVATVSDAASIYGEAQATLTLLPENVKHVGAEGTPLEGDDGVGIVFGDQLGETLSLTDAKTVVTTKALRVTRDAAGNPVNGDKTYYDIGITNKEGINSNYELVTVTPGKYTVYPRKIKLTARAYGSVYGDDVDAGMGGYDAALADTQFGSGLDITSTVIFESDRTAFGKGISYAYSEDGAHKDAGGYKFNVKFDHAAALEGREDIGINYAVEYGAEATHTIAARQVTVLIASPTMQSSEYGETPVVTQGTGTGTYWMPQYTSNAETKNVVVLPEDMEAFVLGIQLYIADAVDGTAPVGKYPLMGRYTGSKNYEVDFSGVWEGEIGEEYKDPEFGAIEKRAGTYTITRRNISMNILTSLASEYGDDLVKFWESGAYTFSRPDGKKALVNGDELTLAATLFYIQVSSSEKIYGGDGNEKFESNHLRASTYTVIFDSATYKSSAAYSEGVNANYEISDNIGRYTVDKRAIKIEVGVQLPDGHFELNPEMEYGDTFSYAGIPTTYAAPKRSAQISRTTEGLEGSGFVGDDYITMLGTFLATDDSISNYLSGLTTSGHLRVGTYNFTARTSDVSNDYNVEWEFGTLKVNPRTVHVTLREQTTTYTGVEPNVSNNEWDFVEGYSLASGDDRSIVMLDKTDGVNAGKYDITLSCTDNNYNFIVDDGKDDSTKENAFVITPAVVTFALVNGESVFDGVMHRAEIIFTSALAPTMHALSAGHSMPSDDGSTVTFTFDDNLYTVTFAYSGPWGDKIVNCNDFMNVGTYTVTVSLVHSGTFGVYSAYSGNYCFKYDEAGGTQYEKSTTYQITKATISIPDLQKSPYNRKEQEANWDFANDVNPSVVPHKDLYTYEKGGERITYAKRALDNDNARLGDNDLPYYRGFYEFTLNLTDDDYKNFMFEGDRQSVTKDFEITPLEIFSSLAQSSAEYDDESRFHGGEGEDVRLGAWSFIFTSTTETPVEGISYNIIYQYEGWGAKDDVVGSHTLLVKVGGYEHAGTTERAATQYFVDGEPIDEARMQAILANIRAFIDAGTYKYTLTFEYKNFMLRAHSGSDTVASLEYEYTITPVLLSVGAFAEKEFNNEEQDADVTSATFIPTSTMTAEKAYTLLTTKGYNGYELSYEPYLEADDNGRLGETGKPVNASTYTVTITLKGVNFAFSMEAGGSYLYTDSSQRFVIKPFNIGTLFSTPGQHLASTAFVGELNGETTMAESGATLYVYTYTGQEIRPELVKATIYLTADSEGIVYMTPEDLAANFSLGSFLDNTYTDIVTENHASLVVTGRGNYTGTTTMSFSIVPMELTAKIGNTSSVYGEQIVLDEKTLITYEDKQPFESDSLQYEFSLVATDAQKRGEHFIAGKYAITAKYGNQNYKITFTGDWNEAGDDDHNGVCGVYTVDKRQILVKIGNQSAQYSGKQPTVNSDITTNWTALSSSNGTGSPIVAGDAGLKINLYIDGTHEKWDVGSYTIKGTLEEDEIGKNYEVTWEDGAFEITAVKIAVTLKPQTSEYDGSVPKAQQGADGYQVTSGEAVEGEDLKDFIHIYIVNAERNARQYQLTGESTSANYEIKFTDSTYIVTQRALVITIADAESYYGEAEETLDGRYYTVTHNGVQEGAIVEGDDLAISLAKALGTEARTYDITGSWNNDNNYSVTWKGTNGTMGKYTIKKRPITVHIKDQHGVYGSINTNTLSQNEGEDGDWYIDSALAEGLTGTPLVGSDVLGVALSRTPGVAPGAYKITGTASNLNYEVTWEGGWKDDDDAGHAGTYTVAPRKVTITVLTQYGTYGEEKHISQLQGTAYSMICTNAGDGITFVPADNVSLSFAIEEGITDVNEYPIYLTITFGEPAHKDWYDITVETNGELQGDGRYKVENAYKVERRKLEVTIVDLNSVYGDDIKPLQLGTIICSNASGTAILAGDEAALRALILTYLHIMVEGAPYDYESKKVIEVGTYSISGESFTSGNYEITFKGSAGESGDEGVYTVEKRVISISIQNAQSTYGDIGDYATAEEKARVDAAYLTYTAASPNSTRQNVIAIGDDKLEIALFINAPQFSTSRHLKQGQYYIWATYSDDEHITKNYTINPIWGEFTVAARAITVRLATNNPSSEYGDPITDQKDWGYEASLTNGGEGDAILYGDIVEFTMATALTGDTVENGRVTATLVEGENDNGNYRIEWTFGTYSVGKRRIVIVVDKIEPVVYGTPWEMPTYTAKRADGEGKAILDEGEVEIVIDVQNPQKSATGFLRWKEGGYSLTADVTGTKQGNYSVTIENIGVVKYVVEKLAITITIEDAESVYGEAFADLKWTDKENKIVEKDGTKDDLQIVLRRVGEERDAGLYPISGVCGNTDYNVTFTGSWEKADAYQNKCGTYEVTRREVHLTVSNQSHAIYGETITIREPVIGDTVKYADGNRYALASGDRIERVVELYLLTQKPDTEWDTSSMLDAGNYTLCVRGIDDNYNIVMVAEGNFLVNEREIHVHIDDQHGVYGEKNEVASNCTVTNGNGTGSPIVGGDRILFTFTSEASKEKATVGSYPIIGSAEAQGDTKLKNYTIVYDGSYEGGKYGTYTITKRIIIVTINDQTAIYGGTDGTALIPTLDNTFYTAAYNGETTNAILDGDDLQIRFTLVFNRESDLSTAGALKANTYAIVGAYGVDNSHTNYEVSFVGGWTGEDENHSKAGTFTVTPRGINVSLGLDGSLATSEYGATPNGPWTQEDSSMYLYALTTGTGPAIVAGDKVAFTMKTLADERSHVGTYPLVGELTEGENDNGNYNFTFTGAFVDTEGGTYEKYNGVAGIYTVSPRKITAEILDYTREYGEVVNNKTVLSALNEAGTDGLYFKLQEDWSVNGDTVEGLGVILDCIAGEKDGAQTYTITGTATNRNYDVTFTGGEGKYTITPRVVYVVILPQVSVYGKPINVEQTMWYAYRNGYKATWSGGTTSDPGHVLATGEKLDELNVRLTKRVAIDGYDYDEGNGIYGGQYAIEGDYSNANYKVIFVGADTKEFFKDTDAFKNTANPYYLYNMFTSGDAYDYADDPDGLREKEFGESGIYTVAPRKVTITLNDISGTYGGNEHTLYGEPLKKGVQLDPTMGTVWRYDYGSEQIDAGHVEYLTFYLGGKFDAVGEDYLTVQDYPVVAYWGLGLGEKSRMRDWNYEITFHGDWTGSLDGTWADTEGHTPKDGLAGKYTVKNATIEQYGDWYEALEYILEHDADSYTMSVNKSMTKVDPESITGKRYLTFKGDVTEATTITYGNLYFNEESNTKVGVVPTTKYDETDPETGAPKVNKAGYWILEVTVQAQYHETATFDLVYHITPDLIVLTLKGDASYEFTYGDYFYNERSGDGKSFSTLEEKLKEWLLGETSVVSAMRFEGKNVAEDQLASKISDLFRNGDVVVSVHKMASNMSTGGYLNAGRYLVTISGGANLEITFVHDYEVITCNPKTVTATWKELSGEAVQGEYDGDGADLFTVTYDGRQHTLDPSVEGVLDGDLITDYAAASYLYDTESDLDGASATPLGYGYYVCRVTSRALGGADGSNYAVAEDLHAYVYVQKRDVTVEIKDKAPHTYGDTEPEFTASDWDLYDGSMAQGELRSALGVVLTRAAGKDVGTYKVTGTYSNANYNVTWKGSWEAEGDPDNGTCGTFTIVPRPITVTLLDKTVTYGTALPADDDLASDITLWHATYNRNPRGVAIIQGDDLHLTMKIGYTEADRTVTGYLMAKSYTVTADWDNENYDVTFESDSTPSLTTSLYIVGKRSLRVSLFDAAPTEYGYDRPDSISHAFTGFTSEDQAYFNEHPGELFIRFFFYDPKKSMELSPVAAYDPVGIYAVCGEITDKDDPIGSNYDVNFVGSWDDNTYPDLVQHAGVYRVTPRTISIIIYSVSSEYGEIAYVPIALQPGSSLVGSDTLEGLGIRYKTAAYYDGRTNKPGVYPIEYDSIDNPNYRVSGAVAIDATYTVLKRKIKIVADDQSGEYGDDHTVQSVQGVHWRAIWVTAEGEPREGLGIAYEDDVINNLRLLCRGILASTRVGNYPLSAIYETGDCYEIVGEEYGDYQVVPREIVVHVESYNDWEYGEDHAARFRNAINIRDRGFYFERKNGSGDAIAFFSDPICNFHLALDVTAASHAGDYAITCVYSDSNYNVEIRGTYMDEDGNVIGGTYTIKPREITVVIHDQTGEYGDVHTIVDRYNVTWMASRPAGGTAIIGTDDLKLTFTTNATEQSGVNGTYYITAVCGNEDYAVTFINGNYKVTPRKLTASVYGESEYGDPLQKMELVLSRTTEGLGGPGIMPWDESFLTISASCAVEAGSPAGHYPVTYTINGELGTNANYEIVNSNEGEYVVLPREIVVNIGSITRTYGDPIVGEGDLTYTVSRANGKEGEAILNEEIAIILRVLAFSRNAGRYTIDMQAIDNDNYHVTVNTGEYTIEQKQITVHIDDKSSEYGSAVEALTVGEIEGLVGDDDLGLSLRVEWGDDLAWHNVGDYAIVGTYKNLNYLVTFDGSWAADAMSGTYSVYKAKNLWLKEYSGDGTVVQGNGLGEGEAPVAKFGEAVIRYYYDEACTQEIEGDLADMDVGVYYAKAIVEDTSNYSDVVGTFTIEVLSSFIYPNGALDVSLFVCLFASQFVVGICALLFIRRRKNKKNQSQNEGTK